MGRKGDGSIGRIKDLTGQRFGRLVVIGRAEDYVYPNGKKSVQWNCLCDCGNTCVVDGRSLKRNRTKSCGCLHKETSAINGKNNKKYNTYNLLNEYGIGYTSKGEEFYFDLEDYDKIKDYYWSVNNDGYLSANKNTIFFHRIILGIDSISWVHNRADHKNHNKLDNQKSNLRIVNPNQNTMNSSLRSDNKSGVKGVIWNIKNNNWNVQIGINGKNKYLGSFLKFEDAVKAREEAEEEYFGEFRYNNSINN